MTVLKYHIPVSDHLLCDNPVCNERATHWFGVKGPDATVTRTFACKEHFPTMVAGRSLIGQGILKKPGEFNPEMKKEEAKP